MAKTDSNRTFIARHMIDRAKELIDSPAPAAPIELVARAHAMILYLIIFVFSGDVSDKVLCSYIYTLLNVILDRVLQSGRTVHATI